MAAKSHYYLNTIPDKLTNSQLQDLLRQHQLPVDGLRADLRTRLQLHYLGFTDAPESVFETVRGFFAIETTKKDLLKELKLRGLTGKPEHKTADLRRILTLAEMRHYELSMKAKAALRNDDDNSSEDISAESDEDGDENSDEESAGSDEEEMEHEEIQRRHAGDKENERVISQIDADGISKNGQQQMHGGTKASVRSMNQVVMKDTCCCNHSAKIEELENWIAALSIQVRDIERQQDLSVEL